MKLCTYRLGEHGAPRAGIVRDDHVHDVARAAEAMKDHVPLVGICDYSSMAGILARGPEALDSVRRIGDAAAVRTGEWLDRDIGFPLSEVSLMAPLPRPNTIRDFLVFEEHLVNAMHTAARDMFPPAAWANSIARRLTGRPLIRPPRAWYQIPAYYKGSPDTVIGPEEQIVWPAYTERLDYELEFGLYIAKSGKDIPESEARSYIAGYTIFNDVSARDVQMKEMSARLGPAKGKDFDTGNVMGPWLVTPDEVGDAYSLNMEAWVNGERWSKGTSAGMRFSFEEIIAYVSRSETLHPGDFFGSGTVGTGCGLELGRWIRPGDRVTLKVDRLGELSNPIVRY